jgi:hypothetical protein
MGVTLPGGEVAKHHWVGGGTAPAPGRREWGGPREEALQTAATRATTVSG